jgi:hypothetical protein
MRTFRTAAMSIALALLATATVGQESQPPPTPPPATPPAGQPPGQPPAQPGGQPTGATPPAPSTEAPAPVRGVVQDDQFIPTQELQADEEATFPVDI